MKRIKYLGMSITVTLLLTMLHSSCLKDWGKQKNECSENLDITGPHSVVEGDPFTLTPVGYYEEPDVNTDYYWDYPPSTGWYYSTGNTENVMDPDPISVDHADKRHEGVYVFRVDSGNDHCNSDNAVKSHEVHILPKPSPCFDSMPNNYMEVYDAYYDNATAGSANPYYEQEWDSTSFEISVIFPGARCEMLFDLPIPDYSSSYQLRDGWPVGDDIENPLIEAEISFNFTNESGDPFELKSDDQELYLKREGDDLFVTLCDVVFVHKNLASRTINLSGKIYIQL